MLRAILIFALLGLAAPAWAAPTNVIWTAVVGASVSGNTLTKTAINGWGNSGAWSSQSFPGDGYTEFTWTTSGKHMMGLAVTNVNTSYVNIPYAAYQNGSTLRIYENGSLKKVYGTSIVVGDVVRISRTGSTITYYVNLLLVYTSLTSSTGVLHADSSLFSSGVVQSNAIIESLTASPSIYPHASINANSPLRGLIR